MPEQKRTTIIAVLVLLILLSTGIFTQVSSANSMASLNLGSTIISEGQDFGVFETGQRWWNLDGAPYPDFPTAMQSVKRSSFSVQNGFWDIQPTSNDPVVWMLWTGIANTQKVLNMGDRFPIDAGKYTLLSFYMCLDQAPSQANGVDDTWAANAYWFYDRAPHLLGAPNGFSTPMLFKQQNRFPTNGSCELIVFDMDDPNFAAQGAWNNSPTKPIGLRLDPINQQKDLTLHWMRLTTVDTSNSVDLNWNNAGSGQIDFFLSQTGCNQSGIQVGSISSPGPSGTFKWGAQLQVRQAGFPQYPFPLPESFQPGTYFVYMRQGGSVTCASQNLIIQEAPIFSFQKPGFTSGPDYATQVLNDPWGMRNSADVSQTFGFSVVNYANEIFNGLSIIGDPQITLHVSPSGINTNQYRYATFRLWVEGQQNIGAGWVQRFHWWKQSPSADLSTTQDTVVYEGWHTYSYDLETVPLEPGSLGWNGSPTTLRFDPLEFPIPTDLHLDYILLTGDETVNRGDLFPVYYQVDSSNPVNLSFYYDTDTNPNNGRTLMNTVSAFQPIELPGAGGIFLPIVLRSGPPNEVLLYENSELIYWNTAGVPRNTYYLSAVVSNGIETTTWYSELPVKVD